MVTVIATGFDTHAQMMRPQPQPRVMEAAVNAPTPTFAPSSSPEDEEDINVPTFIRRQAD